MEIFGIGASELIFILIIAIIVLGPRDMQKAGRTIGRWLNQLVRSDSWKAFQKTSSELRNLPRNLMREANMELGDIDKEIKEIRQTIDPRLRPPTSMGGRSQPSPHQTDTPPQASSDNDSTEQNG
jgi:sec-independent protein translocase protein TatB